MPSGGLAIELNFKLGRRIFLLVAMFTRWPADLLMICGNERPGVETHPEAITDVTTNVGEVEEQQRGNFGVSWSQLVDVGIGEAGRQGNTFRLVNCIQLSEGYNQHKDIVQLSPSPRPRLFSPVGTTNSSQSAAQAPPAQQILLRTDIRIIGDGG